MASVLNRQNRVTSGMTVLAIVVICPSLFSTICLASRVSMTFAVIGGIWNIVRRPFVTEPTRSTPFTLKSVSM